MNGNNGEDEGAQKMEGTKRSLVLTWGYLPGSSPHRTPLLSPVVVPLPDANVAGDLWRDVCGGGCGFAVAISEFGKLITWGSTDDQGQSYLTSGKHEEIPEPFLLPTEAPIIKAAAGWAHRVSITETGQVYTWGWKECVPSGKIFCDFTAVGSFEKDTSEKQSSTLTEQANALSQVTKSAEKTVSFPDNKSSGEESVKRRKISPSKQELESSPSADEILSAPPCLVALDPGVRITSVAAGGRHTLALSDAGQVWGWGYGGEGQLGLGSRIKMVSSPHLIPCIEPLHVNDRNSIVHQGSTSSANGALKFVGSYIKGITCGGRHSAVVTDAGALLTFGWGLYGQCGQGNTNDVLRPTCVSALLGTRIDAVAAGLWHTLCISVEGRLHTFGGNQFGQLGLGSGADQAETLPRPLDDPVLESKHAKIVSCGARLSAVLTGMTPEWNFTNFLISDIPLCFTLQALLPSPIKLMMMMMMKQKEKEKSPAFLPFKVILRHCFLLNFLKEDGQIFCWGWNKYGQLGLGDSIDRNIPSQVPVGDCLPQNIACGWWHTLLLGRPLPVNPIDVI